MATKKKSAKSPGKRKAAPRKTPARKRRKAATKSAADSESDGFVILLDQPKKGESKVNSIELPADCTIGQANKLRDQLLKALNNGQKIAISASAVQEIDTASLQVLCCFTNAAAKEKVAVSWLKGSDAFLEATGRLGLIDHICPKLMHE